MTLAGAPRKYIEYQEPLRPRGQQRHTRPAAPPTPFGPLEVRKGLTSPSIKRRARTCFKAHRNCADNLLDLMSLGRRLWVRPPPADHRVAGRLGVAKRGELCRAHITEDCTPQGKLCGCAPSRCCRGFIFANYSHGSDSRAALPSLSLDLCVQALHAARESGALAGTYFANRRCGDS